MTLLQAAIALAPGELILFESSIFSAFILRAVWLILGLHVVDSFLNGKRLLTLQMVAVCEIVGEARELRLLNVS